MSDVVRVLYIAAWGRSGSTLLHDALGQVKGLFSAGELQYVWGRSLRENRLCGCGKRFRDCSLWQEIFLDAFGGFDAVDSSRLEVLSSHVRTRHLPWLAIADPSAELRSRLAEYLGSVERLYGAIARRSGCRVIVDSSKAPSYAYLLSLIPTIELNVVHLVRDPRGVAYSWQRRKIEPDTGEEMARYGVVKSSLLWAIWNIGVGRVLGSRARSTMVLRYEDFVSEPRQSLEKVLELVEESAAELPLVGDAEMQLDARHSTTGNPNRFRTGSVRLRPDRAWETRLSWLDRWLVTILDAPLLLHYGYALAAPRGDDAIGAKSGNE